MGEERGRINVRSIEITDFYLILTFFSHFLAPSLSLSLSLSLFLSLSLRTTLALFCPERAKTSMECSTASFYRDPGLMAILLPASME